MPNRHSLTTTTSTLKKRIKARGKTLHENLSGTKQIRTEIGAEAAHWIDLLRTLITVVFRQLIAEESHRQALSFQSIQLIQMVPDIP